MTILPTRLLDALGTARRGLARSSEELARANLTPGAPQSQAALAAAARSAIFADAVAGALHARIAEIRTVTK